MSYQVRSTQRFTATIGINPGYGHANEKPLTIEEFVDVWDQHASEVSSRGLAWYYIPAVVLTSKVVYPSTAGCPWGGEDIFVVMGVCNPTFYARPEVWKMSVIEVVSLVREHFKQETVQVVFDQVESHYARKEETDG